MKLSAMHLTKVEVIENGRVLEVTMEMLVMCSDPILTYKTLLPNKSGLTLGEIEEKARGMLGHFLGVIEA